MSRLERHIQIDEEFSITEKSIKNFDNQQLKTMVSFIEKRKDLELFRSWLGEDHIVAGYVGNLIDNVERIKNR